MDRELLEWSLMIGRQKALIAQKEAVIARKDLGTVLVEQAKTMIPIIDAELAEIEQRGAEIKVGRPQIAKELSAAIAGDADG